MHPRIAPITKPSGIFQRIMFFLLKKEFGKVIMPAKVIYARYPKIGMLVKKLYEVESGFKNLSETEKFLIQNLVATLNGCSFCMDISMKKYLKKNVGLEKFRELLSFERSDQYTPREKAIFNYVTDMTKNLVVSDSTFRTLSGYCNDKEIIEITYISASENFLNRMLKPLNISSDELCEIR